MKQRGPGAPEERTGAAKNWSWSASWGAAELSVSAPTESDSGDCRRSVRGRQGAAELFLPRAPRRFDRGAEHARPRERGPALDSQVGCVLLGHLPGLHPVRVHFAGVGAELPAVPFGVEGEAAQGTELHFLDRLRHGERLSSLLR